MPARHGVPHTLSPRRDRPGRPARMVGGARSASGDRPSLRPRRHRHRLRQLHRRPPVRRPRRGDPRAGHVRRHLPQRRVHPHQDVRLPRRPGPRGRARAGPRRRHPVRRSALAARSATGSSAGSTRSPSGGRGWRASERPTSRSTRATPGSSTSAPSTPAPGETITGDQFVIAAGCAAGRPGRSRGSTRSATTPATR